MDALRRLERLEIFSSEVSSVSKLDIDILLLDADILLDIDKLPSSCGIFTDNVLGLLELLTSRITEPLVLVFVDMFLLLFDILYFELSLSNFLLLNCERSKSTVFVES